MARKKSILSGLSDGQKAIVIRMQQGWMLCHWRVLDDYCLHMSGAHRAPFTVSKQNVDKLEKLNIIHISETTSQRWIYELTDTPSDAE